MRGTEELVSTPAMDYGTDMPSNFGINYQDTDEESEILLRAEDVESSPLTPPQPRTLVRFVNYVRNSEFVTSDDWWSVYIGFVMFTITVPLVLKLSMSMPVFSKWKSRVRDTLVGNDSVVLKLLAFHYITLLMLAIAFKAMKKSVNASLIAGFSLVFWISVISKIIGANVILKSGGLGDSVWAIIIGALITNTVFFSRNQLPDWLKNVVVTEFYIKISVVLLAVDLSLFGQIGLQGFITTWVDTPIVLGVMFLVGVFIFRLSKDDSIILVGGATICGSSAATAITSSIGGDKQVASLVIAIMSFFTVPLIPTMPLFATALKINPRVSGAWIGGSVDSTGAVIATASSLGPTALETAAIVKMMQNIIIGPVCLLLTVIWTKKFNPKVLYDRFPKFVLGFMILSGIISVAIPRATRSIAQKNVFIISEWFSSFGFVCIGLELNMRKLFEDLKKNGIRFIALYIICQLMDLCTTFGFAYVSFTFLKL